MHEIAHSLCDHEPSQILLSESTPLAMRSFNAKQEDEANWLGWTLLLPRPALIHCAALQYSVSQIAEEFEVSEQLVRFRQRITGVELQFRYRKRVARP
jgi:Zn-dependent peptidase ImmA (M78 family)